MSPTLVLVLAATLPAAGPVRDKNLEDAIRATLMMDKGDLTDDALNKVYVLKVPGKGIKDLTGLEKCKNLAELQLSKNEIADLKPLAGLTNLQSLDRVES